MLNSFSTLTVLFSLLVGITAFFKTSIGRRIGNFLPTPFWIYFSSIVCSTFGWLPPQSPVYPWIGLHVLSAALVLMLIGTSIQDLIKMGPPALMAMILGIVTMVLATWISFAIFGPYLPQDGWKAAGALLATWTGGSANMLAVKELLNLSESGFAPLVIVDTFLSYGWMAILIFGAGMQRRFDSSMGLPESFPASHLSEENPEGRGDHKPERGWGERLRRIGIVLLTGFSVGEIMIFVAGRISPSLPLLSSSGWAVLFSTTAAVLLAMTPLKKVEQKGASIAGQLLLYLVLLTIGAKTNLRAASGAPIFMLFGSGVLIIHGVLLLYVGRLMKLPLFLLATSSQANVGGAISAPIVASVYRPGVAHIGVLMAILGVVVGTYVGAFGGWVCRFIPLWAK